MSRIGFVARYKYFTQEHIFSSCHGYCISTPAYVSVVPKCNNKCDFQRKQTFRSINLKRVVVHSSAQPGPRLPSGSPRSSWKMWILGIIISAILPFWGNKWGPFKKLENEVKAVVETAEHVAEAVEKVAEGVEHIAEEIADQLPEGGKLKEAATFVENVANVTAKDAHLADQFIEKIEEVEKEVESFIDPLVDSTIERTKE